MADQPTAAVLADVGPSWARGESNVPLDPDARSGPPTGTVPLLDQPADHVSAPAARRLSVLVRSWTGGQRGEAALGAVVAVPTVFTHPDREALLEAFAGAGVPRVQLVDAPAAALTELAALGGLGGDGVVVRVDIDGLSVCAYVTTPCLRLLSVGGGWIGTAALHGHIGRLVWDVAGTDGGSAELLRSTGVHVLDRLHGATEASVGLPGQGGEPTIVRAEAVDALGADGTGPLAALCDLVRETIDRVTPPFRPHHAFLVGSGMVMALAARRLRAALPCPLTVVDDGVVLGGCRRLAGGSPPLRPLAALDVAIEDVAASGTVLRPVVRRNDPLPARRRLRLRHIDGRGPAKVPVYNAWSARPSEAVLVTTLGAAQESSTGSYVLDLAVDRNGMVTASLEPVPPW